MIQGTDDSRDFLLHHVRVDPGCFHIGMPHPFLNDSNVHAVFEQMGGKKRLNRRTFYHAAKAISRKLLHLTKRLWTAEPYNQPSKYIDTSLGLSYFTCMETRPDFEWDSAKDELNQRKHGVSFAAAQLAFPDSHRVILEGLEHGDRDKRFYCLGVTV